MGFFVPVKGYSAPHALVSPDVLPYRPNRGVHVTLTRVDDPLGHDAHLMYRWYDRVRIPDLLGVPGVAGAWTFSLHQPTRPSWQEGGAQPWSAHELRLRLLYLDGDPLEVAGDLAEHEERWAADGRGRPSAETEEVLFSAPLAACLPFQPCPPTATPRA
jgi:hypothetical protein